MTQLLLSLLSQSSEGEEKRRHDIYEEPPTQSNVHCMFLVYKQSLPRRKACSNGYSVSTTSPGKGSFSNLLSYSEQLVMGRGAGITFPNYYAVAGEDDHIFGLFLMSFTSLSNIQLPIYSLRSSVQCQRPSSGNPLIRGIPQIRFSSEVSPLLATFQVFQCFSWHFELTFHLTTWRSERCFLWFHFLPHPGVSSILLYFLPGSKHKCLRML